MFLLVVSVLSIGVFADNYNLELEIDEYKSSSNNNENQEKYSGYDINVAGDDDNNKYVAFKFQNKDGKSVTYSVYDEDEVYNVAGFEINTDNDNSNDDENGNLEGNKFIISYHSYPTPGYTADVDVNSPGNMPPSVNNKVDVKLNLFAENVGSSLAGVEYVSYTTSSTPTGAFIGAGKIKTENLILVLTLFALIAIAFVYAKLNINPGSKALVSLGIFILVVGIGLVMASFDSPTGAATYGTSATWLPTTPSYPPYPIYVVGTNPQSVSPMSAGDTENISFTIGVPSNTPAGSGFFRIVWEDDEGNIIATSANIPFTVPAVTATNCVNLGSSSTNIGTAVLHAGATASEVSSGDWCGDNIFGSGDYANACVSCTTIAGQCISNPDFTGDGQVNTVDILYALTLIVQNGNMNNVCI